MIENQETTKVVSDNPLKGIEEDYIEQIKQLKNNTVSKEAFEELEAEHKRLIGELVNGQTTIVEAEVIPDINQMRKELFTVDQQFYNLDYAQRILALRKAIMQSGGQDPFLPSGINANPTTIDEETAQRVADVLEQCIEVAQGDNGVFTAALQSRLIDPRIPGKNKK